jgi:hypothetical protein
MQLIDYLSIDDLAAISGDTNCTTLGALLPHILYFHFLVIACE